MSRSRHKKRAEGGSVKVYSGGDSNVMKEAHERKHGGAVHEHEAEGEKGHRRHDRKRARGGGVAAAVSAPGRKRGGGVGADKHPLSSAASVSHLKGEI